MNPRLNTTVHQNEFSIGNGSNSTEKEQLGKGSGLQDELNNFDRIKWLYLKVFVSECVCIRVWTIPY